MSGFYSCSFQVPSSSQNWYSGNTYQKKKNWQTKTRAQTRWRVERVEKCSSTYPSTHHMPCLKKRKKKRLFSSRSDYLAYSQDFKWSHLYSSNSSPDTLFPLPDYELLRVPRIGVCTLSVGPPGCPHSVSVWNTPVIFPSFLFTFPHFHSSVLASGVPYHF